MAQIYGTEFKDGSGAVRNCLVNADGELLVTGGGGGGGGAVTIVNGGDVAEGSTTDAGVITDIAGTVSAKLRGLIILTLQEINLLGSILAAVGSGGNNLRTVEVDITTTGAYVTGDVVGGIISVPLINASTGLPVEFQSIQIDDKDGNSPSLTIYFFKATPAGGTYTDNAPLAWGTGDSANKVNQMCVFEEDWILDDEETATNISGAGVVLPIAATTLFMLIIAQSAATYTNGNLKVKIGVRKG